MLAAHRNGGRTSVASFARAWDEFTDARRRRRATRREVRTLRSLLEDSLDLDPVFEHASIAELAAQIRAEREARAGRCEPRVSAPDADHIERALTVPEPDDASIRVRRRHPVRDLLTATERELDAGATASRPGA
jgi:hypothetical protein